MGLTGLQIFKLLPNTNCKECGYPTCLAFAMKLAAGKEALEKCPYASAEAKAALGAASAPPIRGLALGAGERALSVGEETVFFRHEKTFVHPPALFLVIDPARDDLEARLDRLLALRIERAGETFRVDGVAVAESPAAIERATRAATAAARRGLPVAVLASTPAGAAAILSALEGQRPLLVAPSARAADPELVRLAAARRVALSISGPDLESLATAASAAQSAGVVHLVLEPPGATLKDLHAELAQIRRGALDRVHPGLGHPVLVRAARGQIERAILGVTKFASILLVEDEGGETWLPLWTLRQNIYTDPQKPLQITPGLYPIGEPTPDSPLLVTTNFSLTYFIVATEIESTGLPCHLAVVDAEGMSVLTAWSAGKLSGERVAKALAAMGALDRVAHKRVVIPGYVSVISGELEDALGQPWRVISGPQEASDLAPFFRDTWPA